MKKILIIFLCTVLVMYTTSCGDFLDINKDPNVPADAPVDLVLPAAIASTAGVVGGNYAILGGIWSQYYAQNNASNQYKNTDAFNLQTTDYNNSFNELYAGALSDYEFVRKKSAKDKNWSFYLIATTMQAYTFQILVDLYDEIPFSEALLGDVNRAPHYEKGAAIYDSLIARIDKALAKDFSSTVAGVITSKAPDKSDFIFGTKSGTTLTVNENIAKWKKFANTLKLKIYLRQIKARPSIAQAGIQAMYNAGAEFLTEDAAMTQFVDIASKSNPLYEQDQRQLNTNGNLRASRTLLSYLQVNNDPRLDEYYLAGSGGQRAMDQGNYEAPTSVYPVGAISRALINATDPVYFISASESYFLQAEAALLGFGSGNSEDLYLKGIEASLDVLGIRETKILDINGKDSSQYRTLDTLAYRDVDNVAPDKTKPYAYPANGSMDKKLEAIIVQKWIALAGTHQGIEAFFERNRTGYPKTSTVYSGLANGNINPAYVAGQFVYPKEGVTAGLFAKRLLFPDTERRRNPNTPAQKALIENVWWNQ